jgi:hypothetical protein
VFETNHQEQLIFKHAISTVVIARPSHAHGSGAYRYSGEQGETESKPAETAARAADAATDD